MERVGVTVVGAGVVGLSVARRLARSPEVRLRVLADRVGARTSSRVAGALWFPYQVGPEDDERTLGWARGTYEELVRLSGVPASGVRRPLPFYEPTDSPAPPAWSRALPAGVPLRWVEGRELPPRLQELLRRRPPLGAWCFDAPILDPAAHLDWLVTELPPGALEEARVASLASVRDDVVVNCTGRRARALTGDERLRPSFGQVVVTDVAGAPREFAFADDRDAEAPLYAIPRGREVVLGGCNLVGHGGEEAWTRPTSPSPDPGFVDVLRGRLGAALELPPSGVSCLAEWRPYRESGVRVEGEGRVVHCYGHGGAGFTLALGCAEAVLDEVARRAGRDLRGSEAGAAVSRPREETGPPDGGLPGVGGG